MTLTLDKIIASFNQDKPTVKIPKTVWRIKIGGNFISTLSRKTVWKRIGDAKNAIINHIETLRSLQPDVWTDRTNAKAVLQDMIQKNLIEFVELPI